MISLYTVCQASFPKTILCTVLLWVKTVNVIFLQLLHVGSTSISEQNLCHHIALSGSSGPQQNHMCSYPLKVFYRAPYIPSMLCIFLLFIRIFNSFFLSKQVLLWVSAHCFEMFWTSRTTYIPQSFAPYKLRTVWWVIARLVE